MSPQPRPAPLNLYILIRIRQEVNNEWKCPSGVINSILLCVTFHARLFSALCLNIRYNPLKYQRWTNHINVDIASPGTRAHYALSTEAQPHHLLYCLTWLQLTPQWTQTQAFYFLLFLCCFFYFRHIYVLHITLRKRCNQLQKKIFDNRAHIEKFRFTV